MRWIPNTPHRAPQSRRLPSQGKVGRPRGGGDGWSNSPRRNSRALSGQSKVGEGETGPLRLAQRNNLFVFAPTLQGDRWRAPREITRSSAAQNRYDLFMWSFFFRRDNWRPPPRLFLLTVVSRRQVETLNLTILRFFPRCSRMSVGSISPNLIA